MEGGGDGGDAPLKKRKGGREGERKGERRQR
jgi:hypothetical protein